MFEAYTALSFSLISATLGIELLSLINAWVKSSGIWTFWSPSREGTVNWGAVMSAKGLTAFIPSIADLIALLTEAMSFWMDVLRPPRVVSMKLVICDSGVRLAGGKCREVVGTNLLSGRDKNGEGPTDNKFEEAKEGGAVDVNQEIDDAFHGGQAEDESGPSTVEGSVDGVSELLVCCESHVPGKVGSRGSGPLCGSAAGKKVLLGAVDGTLDRITRRLNSEDDEEERKNGVGNPSQGEEMRQLEIWLEGGRHCRVVNGRWGHCACRHLGEKKEENCRPATWGRSKESRRRGRGGARTALSEHASL